MTWLKENKFLGGLLFITLLLGALIIFLGSKFGTSLEEIQSEINSKKSDLEKMKALDPYPTIEHAKSKEENLRSVLEKHQAAREKLLAFRPENLNEVTGAVFSENLTSTVAKVKALFPEEGALPKSFNLGFEAYSGGPPKEGSTGILTYQLAAMEYLFENLASAGVTRVVNLSREKLPAENGEDWPDMLGKKKGGPKAKRSGGGRPKRTSLKKGGRNTRGKAAKSPFEQLPAVAHRMPFELVVKATEGPARKFLSEIANSENFFFETRLVRVLNPSPIPSSGKAAASATPKKVDDFGADFVVEGEEEAPKKMMMSEKILNKVSGGDELVVYLRADLLLFIEEQQFPELK